MYLLRFKSKTKKKSNGELPRRRQYSAQPEDPFEVIRLFFSLI